MKYITAAGRTRVENQIRYLAWIQTAKPKLSKSRAAALRCERIGMMNLASEMGVHCICAKTPEPTTNSNEDCVCAGTQKAMFSKLRKMPGRGTGAQRGDITLAGTERKGCRDKDGEFVPVAQCNPAQYMSKDRIFRRK